MEWDQNMFMDRLFGVDRKNDSNRCRVAAYMWQHRPHFCELAIMAMELGYTSTYGGGVMEKFRIDHIQPEILRIIRRAKNRKVPFTIIKNGNSVALVQTGE